MRCPVFAAALLEAATGPALDALAAGGAVLVRCARPQAGATPGEFRRVATAHVVRRFAKAEAAVTTFAAVAEGTAGLRREHPRRDRRETPARNVSRELVEALVVHDRLLVCR
jgi:hypothetical protein